jgi:NAD(P)-dependent dehydrogenase (short-subunit alcohol dehydrogenase family)
MENLKERVAVVTGGANGIGYGSLSGSSMKE